MTSRFILFRRAGVFYSEDTTTRKQTSLRTKDEAEATVLLNAKNESFRQPVLNVQIARAYLTAGDPRTGNALSGRNLGFGETGIAVYLLLPGLRHQERMNELFLRKRFILGGGGQVIEDADWKGDRVNDKGLGAPAGKGYAKGQRELPASSGFAHASGATLEDIDFQCSP